MMSRLIAVLCLSLLLAAGIVVAFMVIYFPCPDYECEPLK